MPEPAVITIMRQFRTDLLAREVAQQQQMARRWLAVERMIEGEIEMLARDLAGEKDAGRSFSQAKLYRMQRYQSLLQQLKRQVSDYTDYAETTISREQSAYARLGLEHAQATIAASSPTLAASFDRLPVSAVQTMVGMAQAGTPLATLLADSYPEAVMGLTQALINGTALGWHPTKTATAMRQGAAMGLNRSLVLARDQQLRAWRYASDAQYVASGVVKGKKRLAAHDGRACLACLARDGEVIPLSKPAFDHVQGRCSFVPVVMDAEQPQWQTGEAWFRTLPEEQQQAMMGLTRYQAYKDGRFRFSDLARTTHNDTWGDGLAVTPLRDLLRDMAA